jgi:hypothetical protein
MSAKLCVYVCACVCACDVIKTWFSKKPGCSTGEKLWSSCMRVCMRVCVCCYGSMKEHWKINVPVQELLWQ